MAGTCWRLWAMCWRRSVASLPGTSLPHPQRRLPSTLLPAITQSLQLRRNPGAGRCPTRRTALAACLLISAFPQETCAFQSPRRLASLAGSASLKTSPMPVLTATLHAWSCTACPAWARTSWQQRWSARTGLPALLSRHGYRRAQTRCCESSWWRASAHCSPRSWLAPETSRRSSWQRFGSGWKSTTTGCSWWRMRVGIRTRSGSTYPRRKDACW
mmetsp:Transcript_7891/g.33208  ORF Transcript_7891/g.33208 Transcript_7891/m.33208 type:complete len:215 (+) Transcript_7891:1189-1833(+)